MIDLSNCYTVKIKGHTEYFTTLSSATSWAIKYGSSVIHPKVTQ